MLQFVNYILCDVGYGRMSSMLIFVFITHVRIQLIYPIEMSIIACPVQINHSRCGKFPNSPKEKWKEKTIGKRSRRLLKCSKCHSIRIYSCRRDGCCFLLPCLVSMPFNVQPQRVYANAVDALATIIPSCLYRRWFEPIAMGKHHALFHLDNCLRHFDAMIQAVNILPQCRCSLLMWPHTMALADRSYWMHQNRCNWEWFGMCQVYPNRWPVLMHFDLKISKQRNKHQRMKCRKEFIWKWNMDVIVSHTQSKM